MPDILGYRALDVSETETLSFDWSEELVSPDILIESEWAIEPEDSPVPLLTDSVRSDTATSIKVFGLHFGVVYQLTNTVITDLGRTMVRSYTLRGTRR